MFVYNMQKALFFILLISIAAINIISNSGCANIIPPEGGPRDSIAPVLLKATPADSTLNFRGNKIELTFDEYVDLQDVAGNILFTPLFQNNPVVSVKLKTVTVKFKDSLEANTTYILNFGNSIKDYNEGNVMKNFVYTFSSGPALDSLTLSGKVVLAESGKTDSTLIVMLHRNLDDSAVVKERPRYVSRVDAAGNFLFQNLPSGTFKVYALGEAGTIRRYQRPNQLFAFADSAVTIGKTNAITLYAYKESPAVPPVFTTASRTSAGTDRRLRFTSSVANSTQDLLKDLTFTFAVPLKTFDSAQISLTTDSVFNATNYSVSLDSTRKQLRFKTAWKENTKYNVILNKDFAEDTAGKNY